MNYYWTEEEGQKELKDVIDKAFVNVVLMTKQHEISMRTSTYMLAVRRVADAMMTRKRMPMVQVVTSG